MEINSKTIGFGILILLVLFITSSFLFQKTIIYPEMITSSDGDQIFVERIEQNFFAKVVDFLKSLFGEGKAVVLTPVSPKVGQPFDAYFQGSISSSCKPSSWTIYLIGDSGILKQWSASSELPSSGQNYYYKVTYTPTKSGSYRFEGHLFGQPIMPVFGVCSVPSTTTLQFCKDMVSNTACKTADYDLCMSRIVSGNYYCALDVHKFTVSDVTTTCPSDYCDSWKEVGTIPNGKELERVCYTYGSAPTCSKTSTTSSKITCNSGYVLSGSSCVSTTTTTTTTSYPTTTLIGGNDVDSFKISNLFDYKNHPTESYITLAVILLSIISAIIFIPVKRGKK